MTEASIVWFCVNLKSGGITTVPGTPWLRRQGNISLDWLRDFPVIVKRFPLGRPDVVLLQEAKYFDLHGDELLLFVERQLHLSCYGRYREFLTRSNRSAHHQVVFLNSVRLQAIHHWRGADPDESRGLRGFVNVIVDGDETRTLWVKSIHLDPRDGDARLAAAKQIHPAAAPIGQRALIARDFNSTTSRRAAEPQQDVNAISAVWRYHRGIWPPTQENGNTEATPERWTTCWTPVGPANTSPTTARSAVPS